ncbi:hypothetical protein ACT7DA_05255 [Bacillus pacificus]
MKSILASAAATIEGIRLIKEALPECLTILGVKVTYHLVYHQLVAKR